MNFRVSQFLLFVYYFFFTKNSVQTDVYFCGISKTTSISSQSKLLHRGTLFGKHKYSYMSAQIALRLDFLTKICTWSLALPCRAFLIISLVQIDQIWLLIHQNNVEESRILISNNFLLLNMDDSRSLGQNVTWPWSKIVQKTIVFCLFLRF